VHSSIDGSGGRTTATTNQKPNARHNSKKARGSRNGAGGRRSAQSGGLSTAQKNRLSESRFAFPEERKEPLTDAAHVRSAVARFDQVGGVSDAERDRAWRRVRAAARRYDVEISARGWRELVKGGKAKGGKAKGRG